MNDWQSQQRTKSRCQISSICFEFNILCIESDGDVSNARKKIRAGEEGKKVAVKAFSSILSMHQQHQIDGCGLRIRVEMASEQRKASTKQTLYGGVNRQLFPSSRIRSLGQIEMTKTHCAACCNNFINTDQTERNASNKICTNRNLVFVARIRCRSFDRRFLIGLLKSFLLYSRRLRRVHWQTLSVNHTDRCKELENLSRKVPIQQKKV